MKIKSFLMSKINDMYKSGALHITLGTFLSKFVAFFGSVVVARILSKEDYGVMGYAENIYSYTLIIAAFGLSNAVLRYLVIAEDLREKKRYYNYIVKRSVIINIIISVLMVFFSQIMPLPEKYERVRPLLPILALLLPFQDLLNDGLFTIRSLFKNKLYAYGALISSATLIAGRIIGALCAGIEGVLWSRVLINAIFAILGLWFIKRTLFPIDEKCTPNSNEKRIVNKFSFQYMITNGFWAILMLNDKLLLGYLLDEPAALADYNVASVLPGTIAILATAIGTFVGPYFTKNEKNTDWVKKNYRKVMYINAGTIGLVALFIGLLAYPLINIIYGEQYLNVVSLMRVLLVGAFFNSGLRYTTANLLAAMGEIKYNMIISGVGIVIQFCLDLLLIPIMGVIGVAVSNCIVFLVMSVCLFAVFYIKFYASVDVNKY